MRRIVILLLIALAAAVTTACGEKEREENRQSQQAGQDYDAEFSKKVLINDIRVGEGIAVANNMKVAVHYVGRLNGPEGKEFDNSRSRGGPLIFTVGSRQVIPGWDFGVRGMQPGGIRALTIPPEFAYGDRAIANIIPKNATLYFEVELLEIFK